MSSIEVHTHSSSSVSSTEPTKQHSERQIVSEWIIILSLLCGAIVYEMEITKPHQQDIPGLDISGKQPHHLAYPIYKQTVPTAALMLSVGLPCILLVCFNAVILKFYDGNFSVTAFRYYFHLMVRSMLFSHSATWFVSNILKYSIGRPRPNFIALQHNTNRIADSRLSFPSTHASVAFALLFQLSLYLYAVHSYVVKRSLNLNVSQSYDPWDSRSPYAYFGHWLFYKLRSVPLLSLIVAGIPTYVATYIGCTRITDFQHFYSDVLAGIMIGSFFAIASFAHFSHYLHQYEQLERDKHKMNQQECEIATARTESTDIDINVAMEAC